MKYSCNNKHEFSGWIRQGKLSYTEISTDAEVSEEKGQEFCFRAKHTTDLRNCPQINI